VTVYRRKPGDDDDDNLQRRDGEAFGSTEWGHGGHTNDEQSTSGSRRRGVWKRDIDMYTRYVGRKPVGKFGTLVKGWFLVGMVVGFAAMLLSVYMLARSSGPMELGVATISELSFPAGAILPGLTRPLSDVGYFVVSIGITLVVHELGHAAAAESFGVPVRAFKLVLVCFLIPGALVETSPEDLQRVSLRNRFAIFLAGVWHNIVLCLVVLLVYVYSAQIFFIIQANDAGATIVHIPRHSTLSQLGVKVGDTLVEINNLKVASSSQLYQILQYIELNEWGGVFANPTVFPLRWDNPYLFHLDTGRDGSRMGSMFTGVQVCDYSLHLFAHSFIKKLPLAPTLIRLLLGIPHIGVQFSRYLFTMSASVAFFNLLPCVGLDASHIIRHGLVRFFGVEKGPALYSRVISISTVLVGISLIYQMV